MEATYELVPRIEESFFFGELFTISRIKQILQNRVWVTWNLPVCRLVQLPGHLGHAPWAGTLCRLHYHHRAHNTPHLSGQCILVIIIIKSYSKSLTSSTRSVYSSLLHHGQYHSSPLSGQCTHRQYHNHPHHHLDCQLYYLNILKIIVVVVIIVFSFIINLVIFSCSKSSC